MQETNSYYPTGFLWGVSTSAHQVEGNIDNNWSRWEATNADRLAEEASKYYYLPNWQEIKPQATNPLNYITGAAADHYHRYKSDLQLMKPLGINSYRFSIEWARIEPTEGIYDQEQIEHYRQKVALIRSLGMEPFITLWHFTLPQWFADRGGWQWSGATEAFAKYVTTVVGAITDNKYWVTINEPEIYLRLSYLSGEWPPQKASPRLYWILYRKLIKVHQRAYKAIKEIDPDAQVGLVKNVSYIQAYRNRWYNHISKRAFNKVWNHLFLERTNKYADFIGLNYYFHIRLHLIANRNRNFSLSDMGWEIFPAGIYFVLRDMKKYNKPIFITENGIADAHDTKRGDFIISTLKYINKAIQKGVDVRGYFHWSMLDNFEWDKGFWPQFGLLHVDRSTLNRTMRDSAHVYADLIKKYSSN